MQTIARIRVVVVILTFAISNIDDIPATAGEPGSDLRIGMVDSMFRDLPAAKIGYAKSAFKSLVQAQTGVVSEIMSPAAPMQLARQLLKGELELAVFQGVEFAWARQEHKDLKPLVVIINQHAKRQAVLVTRKDCPAKCWADLKNQTLGLPLFSKEHCHVYLDRHCREAGLDRDKFFVNITRPGSIEDALDDVVEGAVQAALVDSIGLEAYRRRKPGRAEKIKTVDESEQFPDTVVVYKPGAIDEKLLQRFRDGLLRADQNIHGRLLLLFWGVTAFQTVPRDFEESISLIRRAYPPPAESTINSRGKIGVSLKR